MAYIKLVAKYSLPQANFDIFMSNQLILPQKSAFPQNLHYKA